MCYAVGKSKLRAIIYGMLSKKQCVCWYNKKPDITVELIRLYENFKCCFLEVYFYENCATIDATKGKILEPKNREKRLKVKV